MAQRGLIIVISAPSGAGKLTLYRKLLEMGGQMATPISATSRPPRAGEVDGKDYFFLSRALFEQRIEAGDFLEWAEVHENLYGTLHSEIERCISSGRDVFLELDVQGMRSLKKLRDDVISIFLMPPSLEELERRLRSRGTDPDDVIAVRLRNAEEEMAARGEFDHVVVNDEVDRAASELMNIITSDRSRRA